MHRCEAHLLSTMSFSMWSQNSGVSQSGTSGKMRAVVLFVSMMTCLHATSAHSPCVFVIVPENVAACSCHHSIKGCPCDNKQ